MPHIRTRQTDQGSREAKYRNWTETTAGDGSADDTDPDPSNAYADLIQRDPTVCDTCFLTRYDITAVDWWRGTFGWSKYVTWDARPDANAAIPAAEASDGMRLACDGCGARTGTKLRPIPADNIADYTANLSDALADKQIRHDTDVLHAEVADRNTSENQLRQDSHVFAPAVAEAIRAVQSGATARRMAADGGHVDD